MRHFQQERAKEIDERLKSRGIAGMPKTTLFTPDDAMTLDEWNDAGDSFHEQAQEGASPGQDRLEDSIEDDYVVVQKNVVEFLNFLPYRPMAA